MTKEELKDYITEAVESLDSEDMEALFPSNGQPDLYTVVEELIGLKGAVNKLSGSSLKLNHEIHGLIERVVADQENKETFSAEAAEKIDALEEELKSLLGRLMDMDELIQLTKTSFQELPTPTALNNNDFINNFASWEKGFTITIERWNKLLQSSSLYKMGLVGEIFDPEKQEAIGVKHWNNIAANIILETEQAGFLYKGKVIRLAKVVVNKVQEVEELEIVPQEEVDLFEDSASIRIETVEEKPDKVVVKKTQKKPKKKHKAKKKKKNKDKKSKKKHKKSKIKKSKEGKLRKLKKRHNYIIFISK